RAHRLDGDRLALGQLAHARHAHEPRHAVDLGGAGAALAGLAVPADRHVPGLLGLDLVDDVEDDHARAGLGLVLDVLALGARAPPDPEGDLTHFCCSSMIFCRSSRIGTTGSLRTSMRPSRPFFTTRLNLPHSGSLSG